MHFFLDNLIAFGRLLRHSGLQVGTDRLIDLTDALQFVDLGSREDVKAACRTLLIQRQEDIRTFDRIFDEFWTSRTIGEDREKDQSRPRRSRPEIAPSESGAGSTDQIELSGDTVPLRTWSDIESIAGKDFAELTEAEQALARSALARLTWSLAERRTRRWVAGRGSRIDLRRAIAQSLRTGGEITAFPRRRRRSKPRPIVLLCDVSGSMERYTRTLLHFAHTLSRGRRGVEAFLFATRLTRITMSLRAPKPDAAMAAVSRAVSDWSGGTRIGDALRHFHQRWRRRTLHGSTIVIVISDGWDRGDPGVLGTEMARLHRSCHRLIWLNPLIGTVDYAPLTRGLQAALPFVDDFLPVRTLRDVGDLALHLGAVTAHGHHRHLHLHRAARQGLGADAGSRRHRVVHPGL